MIQRLCLWALLASTASRAQTSVNVTGSVKDSRTGLAVAGAAVKIQGSGLATTSDTGGRFSLTGTLGIGTVRRVLPLDSRDLVFSQEAAGPVDIRILDLAGSVRAVLHSGILSAGIWTISPPNLGPGLFVCAIETPGERRAMAYLGAMRSEGSGNSRGSLSLATAAARVAAAAPVDSLLVSKGGYRTARVALASYQQTGLVVSLEDTSTSNSDQATIVPDTSWPCYMPGGIPPPALGSAAFSIVLKVGAVHDVGVTQFGHRVQYDISGGTVTGTKFTGTATTGGLDYELTLADGSVESEQIVILQAGSTPILMRNAGVAPAGGGNVREVLDFEAPNSSSYAWLNTGKYAAVRVLDTVAQTIRLDVYDISAVTLPATKIQMPAPPAVHPSWNCATLSGSQGTSIFTETVTLGSSVTIGASKRGSRNIVPITGGTTTGQVVGKILNGGADYQLTGLDARYTLAPNDGEFIVVRNCGPSNALVPVFEARAAGPYAFLNQVKYFSSAPGGAGGGVSITFYGKK